MATPRGKKAALSARSIAALQRRLLACYDARARTLPWREADDPYRVWISEIMLQQTRVATVIPYYERWLTRFPTLATLADARLDDVLHAWQGLGYYSRARNLHAAARVVRERHGGSLPDDTALLRTLPGVGDYTAGAIASIAYGRRVAAVDGNVRRVLARVLDEPSPATSRLRGIAASLVPPDRPGDFNQALMELGATVCVPRAPRCGECPITRVCRAYARGTQHARPARKRSAAAPAFDIATAAVFDRAGRLLLVRRPARGLLAGLWGLPGEELRGGDDVATAARRAARRVLGTAARTRLRELGETRTFSHTYSHRRERYHVVTFTSAARAARIEADAVEVEARFVARDELRDLALSRAAARISQYGFDARVSP
jgi:A/G-specific adenine glycosylase